MAKLARDHEDLVVTAVALGASLAACLKHVRVVVPVGTSLRISAVVSGTVSTRVTFCATCRGARVVSCITSVTCRHRVYKSTRLASFRRISGGITRVTFSVDCGSGS